MKDREITGISVDAPTKTDYFAGDAFDPAGMKVYVCFDDDAKVEIHDYTVEAPAELTQTSVVKVKWDKYEQTVPVTVTQEFVELKIETAPTKTAYKAGEKIGEADAAVASKIYLFVYQNGMAVNPVSAPRF